MITIASDPEAHVSLLTGFTVDTPSLLFSFYLSPPLTFFSPLFYSVVYPVFPSLCYFLLSLSRAVVSCDCLCSTGGGDTPTPIPIYHVRPGVDTVRKPLGPWKVSDLDIVVDPLPTSPPEARSGGSDGMSRECGRLRRCSP